jgi:hypothetical protein
VATDVYFVNELAAPVVMGVALWRSQSVPRWLADPIWQAVALPASHDQELAAVPATT